jgi:hypothetical protein
MRPPACPSSRPTRQSDSPFGYSVSIRLQERGHLGFSVQVDARLCKTSSACPSEPAAMSADKVSFTRPIRGSAVPDFRLASVLSASATDDRVCIPEAGLFNSRREGHWGGARMDPMTVSRVSADSGLLSTLAAGTWSWTTGRSPFRNGRVTLLLVSPRRFCRRTGWKNVRI